MKLHRTFAAFTLIAVGLIAQIAARAAAQVAPEAPRIEASQQYHDRTVEDPFQWLEEDSAFVRQWVERQNQRAAETRNELLHLEEFERSVEANYNAVSATESRIVVRGQVAVLTSGNHVRLSTADNLGETIWQTPYWGSSAMTYEGADRTVKHVALSADGAHLAVVVSTDGREAGRVFVYEIDIETLKSELVESFVGGASPMGGSVAWNQAGDRLYYTHYPFADVEGIPAEFRYAGQEIWCHTLGQPASSNAYSFGRSEDRFAQLWPAESTAPGVDVYAESFKYAAGRSLAAMIDGSWVPILTENELSARPVPSDLSALSLLMQADLFDDGRQAIYHVELTPGEAPVATLAVPARAGHLLDTFVNRGPTQPIFAIERAGAAERITKYSPGGDELLTVDLPHDTWIDFAHLREDGDLLVKYQGRIHAPVWARLDAATGELAKIDHLSAASDLSFDDVRTDHAQATSADGSTVPVTIYYSERIARDGDRPTILRAYGGFGHISSRWFDKGLRTWFDQGGVIAVAHVRGGGFVDEAWARQAERGNVQCSTEDVIAVAEHLFEIGLTRPGRLALSGGSYDGLLLGNVIATRPDLCAAALLENGVYDNLRATKGGIVSSLTTMGGNVEDREEFQRMWASSPYHRILNGDSWAEYPAIWLHADHDDGRVPAWHAWKLAAAFGAAPHPPTLRLTTTANKGHGSYVAQAEEFAFYLTHMDGPTPRQQLDAAFARPNAQDVFDILDSGVSPDLPVATMWDSAKSTPQILNMVRLSILRQDSDIFAQFLAREPDLNAREPIGGNTTMHALASAAVENQRLAELQMELMRMLADAGADVDAVNNDGKAPLHLAASNSVGANVAFLLEAGADASLPGERQHSALMFNPTTEIARLLVEAGADLAAECEDGKTVLEHVVERADWDRLNMLVDAGADPTLIGSSRHTLLNRYLLYPRRDAQLEARLEWFLDHGLAASGSADAKATPLMVVASRGFDESWKPQDQIDLDLTTAAFLLKHGADPHQVNADGKSAIGLAQEAGKTKLAALMADWEAANDYRGLLHRVLTFARPR